MSRNYSTMDITKSISEFDEVKLDDKPMQDKSNVKSPGDEKPEGGESDDGNPDTTFASITEQNALIEELTSLVTIEDEKMAREIIDRMQKLEEEGCAALEHCHFAAISLVEDLKADPPAVPVAEAHLKRIELRERVCKKLQELKDMFDIRVEQEIELVRRIVDNATLCELEGITRLSNADRLEIAHVYLQFCLDHYSEL